MGISYIGDPIASVLFPSVGTGKCHHFFAIFHQLVDHWRNHADICHIDTDHIKIPGSGIQKTPDLIPSGRFLRRQILIIDRYPEFLKLFRRILYTEGNRIPPRMNGFICKIEIILLLPRFISIQFMIKIGNLCWLLPVLFGQISCQRLLILSTPIEKKTAETNKYNVTQHIPHEQPLLSNLCLPERLDTHSLTFSTIGKNLPAHAPDGRPVSPRSLPYKPIRHVR